LLAWVAERSLSSVCLEPGVIGRSRTSADMTFGSP
jgi:hypothetical protein